MFVETEERPQGEVQTVEQANRKLKLSEAIRIGAMRRPQCHFAFFDDYGGSCALGAAAEALFGYNRMSFGEKESGRLRDHYKDLSEGIFMQVTEMNDLYGYTREQIADWLEAQGY